MIKVFQELHCLELNALYFYRTIVKMSGDLLPESERTVSFKELAI